MTYNAKDYNRLIGMEGFSDTLLKNHFTLYQGYVTNANKLSDTLNQLLKEGKTGTARDEPEQHAVAARAEAGQQPDDRLGTAGQPPIGHQVENGERLLAHASSST